MKRYDLVLFDFDGTLVHTILDIAHYANLTLKEFGYPEHTIEEVQKAVGWGVHELLKKLEPDFAPREELLDRAVAFFKERYQAVPALHSQPYPGVREMLEGPLGRVKKGIVTNKPQDITIVILKSLGLFSHFETVVGLHAGFPPKPDPAGMLHAIQKLGSSREETLYIGDSNVDAETCRNAGVDFGWAEYGYDVLEEGRQAAARFKSAAEWAKLF